MVSRIIIIIAFLVSGFCAQANENVSVMNWPRGQAPTTDSGPSNTWGINATPIVLGVSGAAFTSADQHSAVASVTDAPVSGDKLVITDLIISVDTAMRVDITVEGSSTVLESFYMAANQTLPLVTRGKFKLPTADKKLQVKTSVSGNIAVTAFYYSEK